MKKATHIISIALVVSIFFAAFLLLKTPTDTSADGRYAAQTNNDGRGATRDGQVDAEHRKNLPHTGNPTLHSPFSVGQSSDSAPAPQTASTTVPAAKQPEPEKISPEEAARREKMVRLGYMVPPEYYQKDLASLRQLAKNGDVWAMVHLGEKYYFELQGQTNAPGYEAGIDYAREARNSFANALAAGNIRSAAIIAETYLQENNAVDAYAWHILSEQLGDNISADWFRRTKLYADISEKDKQLARAKLPELSSNVNSLAQKMKLKPVF